MNVNNIKDYIDLSDFFKLITNNKYLFLIFLFFQFVSFFLWNNDFGGYLFNTYFVFFLIIIKRNRFSYFLGLTVLIVMIFYAVLSFYYKNPNELYKENYNIKKGDFVIETTVNKGVLHGDLAVYGQNPLEDFNYDGFVFYNKELKVYVVMSCSLLQESCFFHDKYGEVVSVRYVEDQSRFWYKNNYYIFQIKYKDIVIDDYFFIKRYERDRLVKVCFIFFYLLVNNIIFFKLKSIKFTKEN